MFHTMGIYHEQSRSDRDDHITVHLDRAQEDFRDQFIKKDTKNNHPYDFESIMQYSANVNILFHNWIRGKDLQQDSVHIAPPPNTPMWNTE